MTPILIVIPFWNGDKSQAIELCRVIAGLEVGHVGTLAHVMLVARQDCKFDPNMVKIVASRFNTFTHQSSSPLKGWPSGPNGMFASAMRHIGNNAKGKYECVYWMEPDAVPICPNWHWNLVQAWRARHPTSIIVGCRSDCNGDGTGDHITGCAIYHPEICKLMPQLVMCDQMAWDYQHRAEIVRRGGPTQLIENWYKATNADPGILDRVNVGVSIIHGFKDNSLIKLVKNKYRIP